MSKRISKPETEERDYLELAPETDSIADLRAAVEQMRGPTIDAAVRYAATVRQEPWRSDLRSLVDFVRDLVEPEASEQEKSAVNHAAEMLVRISDPIPPAILKGLHEAIGGKGYIGYPPIEYTEAETPPPSHEASHPARKRALHKPQEPVEPPVLGMEYSERLLPPRSEDEWFEREAVTSLLASRIVGLRNRIMDYLRWGVPSYDLPVQHMRDAISANRGAVEYVVDAKKRFVESGRGQDGDLEFIESSFDDYLNSWQKERDITEYIIDRLSSKPSSQLSSGVTQRLEYLLDYAKQHGENGLEDLVRALFPEWSIAEQGKTEPSATPSGPALPTKAPETYLGLRGPETPPAFVQRVYGPWLGQGLNRAHIRKLDPKLYDAIDNWSRRNEWPADVDLPKLKEQNDRVIDALAKGDATALSVQGPHSLKALASLEAAQRRRRGRTEE